MENDELYMTPGARRAAHRMGRALIILFFIILVVCGISLGFTATSFNAAEKHTESACDFWRDLAGLPVTILSSTGKPSELSISIIAHSRTAFRGSGCTGPLPPPDPSFKKWAPYFHQNPN